MRDDRAHPRPAVAHVRTYTEASAVKEELRRLGIPASEIELRIVGLTLASTIDSFMVATVFGLIAFAAGPILGFAFTSMLPAASPQLVAGSITLCIVSILALSWWLVRAYTTPGGAGCAIHERIDVVVARAYASDASRILDGRASAR